MRWSCLRQETEGGGRATAVWTKSILQPALGSWTALDPHIEDLNSQELSPVGFFELFFDEGQSTSL